MNLKRKTGIIALFLVIGLAIGYGFLPKPILVETATVRQSPMRVTINEEGKTRVKNRFVVSAPVSGYALRINLDVGDPVEAGRSITELEPLRPVALDPRSRAEAEARVASAKAALHSAEEEVHAAKAGEDYARKELARIRKLYKDGLVTQGKLDGAETDARRAVAILHSSEFGVEVARHDMEAALTALKYSAAHGSGSTSEIVKITSPVNGQILKIYHESEGVVREGEPLIEIGDPSALEIEVDVLSSDAVKILPGTRVVFERWGGNTDLEGIVRVVEPAGFTKVSALGVEEQRVLVISDITSPSSMWSQLGDSYRVEARFILWEKEQVLQAPTNALFRNERGWAVFAVQEKKARLRPIQIDHKNGLSTEIVSGLREGEMIITHPDSSIEDGSRVRFD